MSEAVPISRPNPYQFLLVPGGEFLAVLLRTTPSIRKTTESVWLPFVLSQLVGPAPRGLPSSSSPPARPSARTHALPRIPSGRRRGPAKTATDPASSSGTAAAATPSPPTKPRGRPCGAVRSVVVRATGYAPTRTERAPSPPHAGQG